MKMASNENKDPIGNLMDKLRSLLGFQERPNNTLPPKARFSIWYFLIAIFLFTYLQQYFLSAKVETIPYSQFKQYIAEGNVGKLIIGPENINGTLKGTPGQKFATVRVNDPNLVQELDERKVSYSGQYENKFLSSLLSWIIPIGIFFLIWRYAMKKMGPGMRLWRNLSSMPTRCTRSPLSRGGLRRSDIPSSSPPRTAI
jgi:cell division protease FtsH